VLTRLDSVLVDVPDPGAAARDFGRLLGIEPTVEGDPGGRGTVVLELANVRLVLRAGGAPGAPAAAGVVGGLRFACVPQPGTLFAPGPVAGPSVPIELVAESGPAASAAGSCPGLDHVVVATPDPERAQRFFGDGLGLRLALDRRFPERGLRLLFFRLAGVTLEVAASLDAPSPDGAAGPDAFHGLAFRVPDLGATHARLLAAGFPLSPIRAGHKPGTRVCTVRGGVQDVPTLLIEHPPPGPARPGW